MKRTVQAGLLALSITLSGALAQAKEANDDVIERVVAVVDGSPLLLSELRARATPFLSRIMEAPKEQRMLLMQQLYSELLTQLIDEYLLEQEARKLSLSVTRSDIERAIDNVRNQSELSEEEFWDAVASQGLSRAQYRKDVRRQLLRLRVINQKVRSRINITEQDIRRRYEQTLRSARRSATFQVSHVFLTLEDDSVTALSRVRKQADEVRKSLTPLNFAEAIEAHGGGDLGWVSQGDLPSELAEALLSLEPGEVSAPVRGPSGVHIFLLRDRKEGGAEVGSYAQLKNRLYGEMVEKAMQKQEVLYLEELRKESLISRKL